MPFTILDNDEVFNTNQAIWMQTDINAIIAGIGGDGVVSGCAVTAQGSPDMTVAVAVGVVKVGAAVASVSAGNVTITTADATNPRIDLIVVSNAGVKSCTAGTAAANPKAPDIPASSVLLAMVYVPANDTTIATNQITDKRNLLNSMFAMWHPVADANYTAIAGDRAVGYTSITAARTVTLPLAADVPAGQELIVADVSGSVTSAITIIIARAGSDTINGKTSAVINVAYGRIRLLSDGSSKWIILMESPLATLFTSTTASWAIPTGTTFLEIDVIGGGGGGGSGQRTVGGASGNSGGSGGGGGRTRRIVRVADLGGATTLDITIGAGGTGAAPQTVDSTGGNAGSAGGATSVIITSGATLAYAGGGGGGAGSAAGTAGTLGTGADPGSAGVAGASTFGNAGNNANAAGAGGGSGGGHPSGSTRAGGAGGNQNSLNAAGGAAGAGGANNGSPGAAAAVFGPGSGGGGGGGNGGGAGGNGGAGGAYGGGGGSGGSSLNGSNSGAGGAGANGAAIIIAWP